MKCTNKIVTQEKLFTAIITRVTYNFLPQKIRIINSAKLTVVEFGGNTHV